MTNERRIRDRLAAIADPKARSAARVEEVKAVVTDIVANRSITRGSVRFQFQRAPQPVLDRLGNVVGVEVFVRVFRGANELHVDGHRRFVPPPMMVRDGTTRQASNRLTGALEDVPGYGEDPREALLQALEQSIAGTPNVAGWRP